MAMARFRHRGFADPRDESGFAGPEGLLMVMALAMPLAFSVWMALLNNFSHDVVGFDGFDISIAHVVREIPGFLSFLVIYLILFVREQHVALVSLLLLGLGAAITGILPSYWGLMLATLLSSIGFHYFEVVNQSLQLQWVAKERAPEVLGRLAGLGSSTAFIAFGAVWLFSLEPVVGDAPPYFWLYLFGGGGTILLAAVAWLGWPHYLEASVQRRDLVLKQRYWLYYALVFLGGARRQIFVIFAAFMMVDKFGFTLSSFAFLLIINHAVNVFFAPFMGRMTQRFGERAVLTFEYVGLIVVFGAYVVIATPAVSTLLGSVDLGFQLAGFEIAVTALIATAAALYIVDHLFFGLHFAQRTYFQKIADSEDIAPTAAVAFTINHIAAVGLPAPLGLLYVAAGPNVVFGLGVALAAGSLVLSRLVPRHPRPGAETTLAAPRTQAAE